MSESTSPGEKPQIEIISDEDWKSRVKAEDAKLDAVRHETAGPGAGQPAETEPAEDEPVALPEASFFTLLQMLSTQAIVALGMVPDPQGNRHVELPIARHFIDLLAVLEAKCQGNLSDREAQFLEGTLHELRMAFVDASRKSGQ